MEWSSWKTSVETFYMAFVVSTLYTQFSAISWREQVTFRRG